MNVYTKQKETQRQKNLWLKMGRGSQGGKIRSMGLTHSCKSITRQFKGKNWGNCSKNILYNAKRSNSPGGLINYEHIYTQQQRTQFTKQTRKESRGEIYNTKISEDFNNG